VRVALSHDLLRQRGAAHGPFRPPGVVLARVEELSSRRRSETPLGDRLRLRKAASMKEMAAQGQAGGLLGKGGPLGIGALDSPTDEAASPQAQPPTRPPSCRAPTHTPSPALHSPAPRAARWAQARQQRRRSWDGRTRSPSARMRTLGQGSPGVRRASTAAAMRRLPHAERLHARDVRP